MTSLKLWPVSNKFKRHRLYLQTQVEESNHAYFVYVQYGFKPYNVKQCSFFSNDYSLETPVGSGIKKLKIKKNMLWATTSTIVH